MFYQWQAQFFENGSAAFARKTNSAVTQHQKTIEQLNRDHAENWGFIFATTCYTA
jgi:hypothetical protein